MKETYVTITGFWHYYGVKPFKIGKQTNVYKLKPKQDIYRSVSL